MHRPRHTIRAGKYANELRAEMTLAEKALWIRIRNRQLGVKFRRQVPIGHWIADFACLNPKIVIEVDDTSHRWKNEGNASPTWKRRDSPSSDSITETWRSTPREWSATSPKSSKNSATVTDQSPES